VPGKNGGTYLVYNRVLKVFVLKHQPTIDEGINQVKEGINKGKLNELFIYSLEIN
jgi:hypothetical protein